MATVTFAGTNLWNSSTTGEGDPLIFSVATFEARQFLPMPQGVGEVVLDLRNTGEIFTVVCRYILSDSDAATLRTTQNGIKSSYGTLSVNSDSVTYCVLTQPPSLTPSTERGDFSGTMKRKYIATYSFRQVRT